MAYGDITARIVEFAGRCGDPVFEALLIEVEGVNDPRMLTLSFPKSSCGKVDTGRLYRLLELAVNGARISVA